MHPFSKDKKDLKGVRVNIVILSLKKKKKKNKSQNLKLNSKRCLTFHFLSQMKTIGQPKMMKITLIRTKSKLAGLNSHYPEKNLQKLTKRLKRVK